MTNEQEIAALASWARYLHWSDLHWQALEELLSASHDAQSSEYRAVFFARMSQWYASLWVVVEGWQALQMSDPFIDGLLNNQPPYCELLRRYRNGVFHYQPDFLDERFFAFLREGSGPVEWTHALRDEFLRFLWEWPDRTSPDRAAAYQLRAELRAVVGWLPENILAVEIARLEAEADAAEQMLASSAESTSHQALELREAISNLRKAAQEARRRHSAQRQTYLRHRWLPDSLS